MLLHTWHYDILTMPYYQKKWFHNKDKDTRFDVPIYEREGKIYEMQMLGSRVLQSNQE